MFHHRSEAGAPDTPLREASGMVLLARETSRIGIVLRSWHVNAGGCWGTIGGDMDLGAIPRESAIRELFEETGYCGKIDLYLAYIFSCREFRYYNYVGIVAREFPLEPDCRGRWENEELKWFSLDDLLAWMEREPEAFHFGLRRLMRNAAPQIRQLVLGETPSVEWFRPV